MCRWASPGGTAPWYNPLTPAAGARGHDGRAGMGNAPGQDASLEERERERNEKSNYL